MKNGDSKFSLTDPCSGASLLLITLIIWAIPCGLSFAAEISGGQIKPPARVIALSPALTEMIFALNFEDKLVGVSEFSDFPKEAQKITSVGPYTKPNLEKIFTLHADLILIPDEGPVDVKTRLDQFKIPYKAVSMRKLDEIGEAALIIGKLMGNETKGREFQKNWHNKFDELFNHKSTAKIMTLVELQNSPLIVAAHNTFLDEIVSGCGGENVVKANGYPQISLESIYSKKIDVVLLADYFATENEKASALMSWKKFPKTKNSVLKILDSNFVSRPGPRLLTGAVTICQTLRSASNPEPKPLTTPLTAPRMNP